MEKRSERHLATRDEILAAAWSLTNEKGLVGWSLRELAARVGMRAPSLYVYFRAKDQIYDAMFGESYGQLLEVSLATSLPDDPRDRLHAMAAMFFDFAVENPARLQLMFWRVIPGFEPSPDAYAPSLKAISIGQEALAGIGITDPAAMDMWTALLTGLITQQASNDPGGDRWRRLLDEAVDMFAGAYL